MKTTHYKAAKAVAAVMVMSVSLAGALPATAGPAAAAMVALGTAKVCGPATVATGPLGLLCFAGGGLLSFLSLITPSP